MEAKQKAEELIEKFTMDETRQAERNAIKCALIAVEEIEEAVRYLDDDSNDYWFDVKQEILKLKEL